MRTLGTPNYSESPHSVDWKGELFGALFFVMHDPPEPSIHSREEGMGMAYRKVYGVTKKAKRRRLPWVLAALGLLLCLHGGVRETVLELIIPGDRQATGEALEVMARDLRQGEALPDAVAAFCREVLSHGS